MDVYASMARILIAFKSKCSINYYRIFPFKMLS